MKREILKEIGISLIIMMFLYASFSKYFDMGSFIRAMHNQPFPSWFSTLLVWFLPPMEVVVAMLLIREKTRLSGLKVTVLLMSAFTAYIAAILLHLFPRKPCSCGGIISHFTWQQHLVFNLFFLVLAAVLLSTYRQQSKSRST